MGNIMQAGQEIGFEGARNFRELGGYRTSDGRLVKSGIFYRGGMLCEVKSDSDRNILFGFGIKSILDLRSKSEAAAHPDPKLEGADYYNICALLDENGQEMEFAPSDIDRILSDKPNLMAATEVMMKKMYSGMAFNNPAFRTLFRLIEEHNVPILFHCSAGKDRTGVAAMLILLALGVDEKTALYDYELTNVYRREKIDAAVYKNREDIAKYPDTREFYTMSEGVSPRAGRLFLSRIKERYGSYEEYFLAEYGLNRDRINGLREMYLE